MNLTEPWTEAAKLAEYRRATWRLRVLDETTRYADAPLTVLACRQPPMGTPEKSGHRDAEDAHGTGGSRDRPPRHPHTEPRRGGGVTAPTVASPPNRWRRAWAWLRDRIEAHA